MVSKQRISEKSNCASSEARVTKQTLFVDPTMAGCFHSFRSPISQQRFAPKIVYSYLSYVHSTRRTSPYLQDKRDKECACHYELVQKGIWNSSQVVCIGWSSMAREAARKTSPYFLVLVKIRTFATAQNKINKIISTGNTKQNKISPRVIPARGP